MRRRRAIAAVAMLALAMCGLAAPAVAAERYDLRGAASITIEGRGYGHGRGLSQWGARGAAGLGLGHEEILDFYYPGTTPVTQGDVPVRVLISADTDGVVEVVGEPGMV